MHLSVLHSDVSVKSDVSFLQFLGQESWVGEASGVFNV